MNGSEETIQKQTESKPSEKPREIPDLQKQIDKAFHTAKMQMAAPVVIVIGVFLSGVVMLFQQIRLIGIITCLFAIALIPLVIYLINYANKRITVPAELKDYMASFSSEQFFATREMERILPNQQPGVLELTQPMEYQQKKRYGIIRQSVGKSAYIGFAVLPLIFAGCALFEPFFLIIAAGTVVLMAGMACLYYFANTGEMVIFDFQEKKIFYGRCRHFRPEKTGKMKSRSFSEIDHLRLSLFEIEQYVSSRHGSRTVMVKCIGLLAVKSDGDAIPLCKASKYNLPRLLALAPDLAEKMGHLVITHF